MVSNVHFTLTNQKKNNNMKKITLKTLEVNSFITGENYINKRTIIGGTKMEPTIHFYCPTNDFPSYQVNCSVHCKPSKSDTCIDPSGKK